MSDEVIDISEVVDGDEPSEERAPSAGIQIVVVTDEYGRGVNLSCVADVSPADLVESALNLVQQVTRAALKNPAATRAADLGLGEDIPW